MLTQNKFDKTLKQLDQIAKIYKRDYSKDQERDWRTYEQRLAKRMKDMEFLAKELKAWTKRRNDGKRKINWRFTKEKADEKLGRHYVA